MMFTLIQADRDLGGCEESYVLTFDGLPPSSNHTQKHAVRGKQAIRYNTTAYNDFKAMIEAGLKAEGSINPKTLDAFKKFLNQPHQVKMAVHSPNVLTKKGLINKRFGDFDNFIKPTLDAIYKPLEADDAFILKGGCEKVMLKENQNPYTFIFFEKIEVKYGTQPSFFK